MRFRFAFGASIAAGVALSVIAGTPAERPGSPSSQPAAHAVPAGPSAATALEWLKQGNQRYVSDTPKHEHQSAKRRAETVEDGQHPFAVVLACSDSRVSPELIFDQGLGDLFVVRVAGNVIAGDECGSIEYGVEHLGAPLVVVMGHSRCGAVTAAVEHAREHGSIPELLRHIEPAVRLSESTCAGKSKAEITEAAIRANVFESIDSMFEHSEALRTAVRDGKIQLVGAMYDLKSGKVEWLGPHPRQTDLVCSGYQDGFETVRNQH